MNFSYQKSSLPAEILHLIFQQVENTSCWKETRDTLYQCQLVCNSWIKPAQMRLYKKVYLPPNKIASFSSTLKTASSSKLGHKVKHIEFYPPALPYPENFITPCPSSVNQDLDIILQHCPNLETICSPTSNTFETNFIWKRLQAAAAANNKYRRLKLFTDSHISCLEDSHIYTSLCLEFRESLIKLRMFPNHKSNDSSKDAGYQRLKSCLKDFESLELLQLYGAFVQNSLINDLDEILNNCQQATKTLQLINCNLSGSDDYYTTVTNPNHSMKILTLKSHHISTPSIRYFAKKLAALEILVLSVESPMTDFEAECTTWWSQMTQLCLPLQVYNINVDELNYDNYLHQIRGCVNLSSKFANAAKKKINSTTKIDFAGFNTEFTMDLSDPEDSTEKYVIELKQNGSCARLFKSYKDIFFNEVTDYDQLFECIQPFTPDTIRVFNKPCELNSNHNRIWNIFNGVLSLIKDRKVSLVHFDSLIWTDTLPALQEHSAKNIQANISTLLFTFSEFDANRLPEISPNLAKIDTLILDGCVISSESPYRLEISLPETKIGRLELKTMAILYQTHIFFPHGYQTIVVTTDTAKITTCTYTQPFNHELYRQPAGTRESADNFVISIRCKELQSLVVSDVEVLEMKN